MKGIKLRGFIVFVSVFFSLYLLTPSMIRFFGNRAVPKKMTPQDPWYYHLLPSEVLKLGLDLQGGLHLVLGIDFFEIKKDALQKLKNQILEMLHREGYPDVTSQIISDTEIVLGLGDVSKKDDKEAKKIDEQVMRDFGSKVDLVQMSGTQIRYRLSALEEGDVQKRAIDQSIEILRNRIDEFGIAEPVIQRQGEDKILVQFPGKGQDIVRIKEIILRTAKLSFQIVRTGLEVPEGQSEGLKGSPTVPTLETLKNWMTEFEKKQPIDPNKPISQWVKSFSESIKDKIPQSTVVSLRREVDPNTKEFIYIPYLLDKEIMISGEDLQDASYGYDSDKGEWKVFFQLTPNGSIRFAEVTGAHVRQSMAIVIDDNVHSAPTIIQKITGGRAEITLGQSVTASSDEKMNEARDTALVLRSGALPARLMFLEERTIGASLGADAIQRGVLSLILGLLLVSLFMTIYYRVAGAMSVLALFLNGVFVLAAMAAFEGTLTLPGLAGLTLTLGMAIDANVLIFEHMREELLNGKSLSLCISEGYHRAFSAILDGHVTAIIAGIVLFNFGYGPIKGFAVTLLIGLVASMYTSIFVTRFMMDYFIVRRNKKTLAI